METKAQKPKYVMPVGEEEVHRANEEENKRFKKWQKKEAFRYEMGIWVRVLSNWIFIWIALFAILFFLIQKDFNPYGF